MPGTTFSSPLTAATSAFGNFFLYPPRLLPCQGEVALRAGGATALLPQGEMTAFDSASLGGSRC